MQEFIKKFLEKQNRVFKEDYTNWLESFVNKHKQFNDCMYGLDMYNEEEHDKVVAISLFASLVIQYFEIEGLGLEESENGTSDVTVSLNLSDNTSIKIAIIADIVTITEISLIEPKTGKANLKDIAQAYTAYDKEENDINEQEVIKEVSGFVRKLIEKEERVLKEDYLNWLAEFVKCEEAFDDEPNRVGYSDVYTEDEKEKIHLVSTLFSVVSKYYEKHGIEYDVVKANFFNQAVTVNLTEDLSIEMRIWCGQGAVTDVSLIEKGTGKVNIKDVIEYYGK